GSGASAAMAAPATAARMRFFFMACLLWEAMERASLAQRANVVGNRHGAQAVRVVGVSAHERARLAALADERVAARHPVVLHEHLGAPLLDMGRDRQLLGVGRGGDEAGRDLEQRRADDAARL